MVTQIEMKRTLAKALRNANSDHQKAKANYNRRMADEMAVFEKRIENGDFQDLTPRERLKKKNELRHDIEDEYTEAIDDIRQALFTSYKNKRQNYLEHAKSVLGEASEKQQRLEWIKKDKVIFAKVDNFLKTLDGNNVEEPLLRRGESEDIRMDIAQDRAMLWTTARRNDFDIDNYKIFKKDGTVNMDQVKNYFANLYLKRLELVQGRLKGELDVSKYMSDKCDDYLQNTKKAEMKQDIINTLFLHNRDFEREAELAELERTGQTDPTPGATMKTPHTSWINETVRGTDKECIERVHGIDGEIWNKFGTEDDKTLQWQNAIGQFGKDASLIYNIEKNPYALDEMKAVFNQHFFMDDIYDEVDLGRSAAPYQDCLTEMADMTDKSEETCRLALDMMNV